MKMTFIHGHVSLLLPHMLHIYAKLKKKSEHSLTLKPVWLQLNKPASNLLMQLTRGLFRDKLLK